MRFFSRSLPDFERQLERSAGAHAVRVRQVLAGRETAMHRGTVPSLRFVHEWFGLTYAGYLVLPRSILQSMPEDWQWRFVSLLEELDGAYGYIKLPSYLVSAKGAKGRFTRDPVPSYDKGRTVIPPVSDPGHEAWLDLHPGLGES